jgi:hypothetical protein
MKEEDIINWPSGVELKPIYDISTDDLEILHELATQDQLDFSTEFIIRLKIKRNRDRKRNDLRSTVAKYLGDKLAKKLNVSSISVPWSQIKEEDILNWPSDVQFRTVWELNLNELQRLHKLSKVDQLDFSPKFLSKFQIISNMPSLKQNVRSNVTKYLTDKLSKTLNVPSIKIPWSEMTAEDIMNWPSDVQFQPFYKMQLKDLKMLNELAKENELDFSPKFLRLRALHLQKSRSRKPGIKKFIRDIEMALCNKLNAGTSIKFKRMPWNILKKGDIVNWPEGMPFVRLSHQGPNRLKLLHKLTDVISFSEQFLQRLSDPSFNRTSLTQFIVRDAVFKKERFQRQILKD